MRNIIVLLAIVIELTGCRNIGKFVGKNLVQGVTKAGIEVAGEKIVEKAIIDSHYKEQKSSQSFLLQAASEINKDLPMMVDRETMLSNVSAKNNALVFNYVIVNYSSTQINSNLLLPNISHSLTNYACSNPDTQKILNNGISIHHSYTSNDHIFIGEVKVSSSDCSYPR
ncbi:MAG: hypothetical protein H0X31_24160 [Nostocaceae cyanobacterium]|nr:hypothetical protein [Nostocaceae cyanobacterium]